MNDRLDFSTQSCSEKRIKIKKKLRNDDQEGRNDERGNNEEIVNGNKSEYKEGETII